jgi:predicted nucleic acid-binding protein
MFVLDTNVVSELLKRKKTAASVAAWAERIPASLLFLSAITMFELEFGVALAEQKSAPDAKDLRRWLNDSVKARFVDRVLPLGAEVAILAARLQAFKAGPERDVFIAATALAHDMTLVTRNTRDVAATGVRLLNPWLPTD